MKESNLKDILLNAKTMLKESGAGEYALDAELFMMKAINFTKVQLFTRDDYVLTKSQQDTFWQMVKKRISKVPTQYILGESYFMGLQFYVTADVLIPRGDTEVLVETVLDTAKSHTIENIMDIGTGSGCIPISLVKFGIKRAVSVDISQKAIEVAKINSKNNAVYNNIKFVNSNLFENIGEQYYGQFDAIVSNPPYIEKEVIKTLEPEVKDNEPMLALDGGDDGLDFYRKIVVMGKKYLKDAGFLFFEIGYNQGKPVSKMMIENGFLDVKVIKDLAGMDRVVKGRKG